jgi:hypothetical protein
MLKKNIVTEQWIVDTYSERNWVEVFDREAKGWLGLKEYQVREKKSLSRHFILVFCAYTFMRTRILRFPQNREMSVLWHKLTGGLRRRWANKLPTPQELNSRWKAAVHSAPLDTFAEALEAWSTAISYRFVEWLNRNTDVFIAYKASLGFVWA